VCNTDKYAEVNKVCGYLSGSNLQHCTGGQCVCPDKQSLTPVGYGSEQCLGEHYCLLLHTRLYRFHYDYCEGVISRTHAVNGYRHTGGTDSLFSISMRLTLSPCNTVASLLCAVIDVQLNTIQRPAAARMACQ
jgi:hypothetical protein